MVKLPRRLTNLLRDERFSGRITGARSSSLRWWMVSIGLLAACAPATNPNPARPAVPFQAGQRWEMNVTPVKSTRSRQFTFVLKPPKDRGTDLSFDDDRIVTVLGVQYVMAGILYTAQKDVAVATAIDLNTTDGTFCLVRQTRSFRDGVLEGRFFIGSVEEFIGFASKDDFSRFGRCTMNRRVSDRSTTGSRGTPSTTGFLEHQRTPSRTIFP